MSILVITGSPSASSRTARLADILTERLTKLDKSSSLLSLRSLPAEALVHARSDEPAIARAIEQVAAARGIVFATPVYKASYSGLLKIFIDILPQFGLRHKVVLPLATGGSMAHVLSIDYALRPVLSSLDPLHVVGGLFVLDKQIEVGADGSVSLDAEVSAKLDLAIASFVASLRRAELEDKQG